MDKVLCACAVLLVMVGSVQSKPTSQQPSKTVAVPRNADKFQLDKHGNPSPTPTFHTSNGVDFCEDWVLNNADEWEAHVRRCSLGQQELTAAEAKQHVGETRTVCGNVISTRYAPSTKGQPTFLNLDKPYPNQIFTVLIWGSDRSKFGKPEADFRDKRICATGKITTYREVPEIVATDPQQIKIE